MTVCHYERGLDVFRIIPDRKADEPERKKYEGYRMRKSYDFSRSVKNPYAKRLKKQIAICLDEDTISYQENILEFLETLKNETLKTKKDQIAESEEILEFESSIQ